MRHSGTRRALVADLFAIAWLLPALLVVSGRRRGEKIAE